MRVRRGEVRALRARLSEEPPPSLGGDDRVRLGHVRDVRVRQLHHVDEDVPGDHDLVVTRRDDHRLVPDACPGVGTATIPGATSTQPSTWSSSPADGSVSTAYPQIAGTSRTDASSAAWTTAAQSASVAEGNASARVDAG